MDNAGRWPGAAEEDRLGDELPVDGAHQRLAHLALFECLATLIELDGGNPRGVRIALGLGDELPSSCQTRDIGHRDRIERADVELARLESGRARRRPRSASSIPSQ